MCISRECADAKACNKEKRYPRTSNLGIDFGINLQCAWGRRGTFYAYECRFSV